MFSFLTVNDILDQLEEDYEESDDEVRNGRGALEIVLQPPGGPNNVASDGDSDDEENPTGDFSKLSRNLLEAPAEFRDLDLDDDIAGDGGDAEMSDQGSPDVTVETVPVLSMTSTNSDNNNIYPSLPPATRKSRANTAVRGRGRGRGRGRVGVTGRGHKSASRCDNDCDEDSDKEEFADFYPPPASSSVLPAGRGREASSASTSSDEDTASVPGHDRGRGGGRVRAGGRGRGGSRGRAGGRGHVRGRARMSSSSNIDISVGGAGDGDGDGDTVTPRGGGRPRRGRGSGGARRPAAANIQPRKRTRHNPDVDSSASDEDDEENNPAPRRPRNPEYERVWSQTRTNVGSKVPDFQPPEDPARAEAVGNLETPYQAWRLFTPDDFIQNIVDQSRLYGMRKGQHNKVEDVTKDSILCVQAVMLLSGYCRLPNKKMYWERQPDCLNTAVADNIRRDTFHNVVFCLHFTDNNDNNNGDRFYKVRPLFENINQTSAKFIAHCSSLSVDEMMIPYYGHHGDKQYIRGKPVIGSRYSKYVLLILIFRSALGSKCGHSVLLMGSWCGWSPTAELLPILTR